MDYRLFFRGREGRIVNAEEFLAPDAAAAIVHALTRPHPGGMELWHRGEMIREFEPESAPTQPK